MKVFNRAILVGREDIKNKYAEIPMGELTMNCFNSEVYQEIAKSDAVFFIDSDRSVTMLSDSI